MGMDTFTECAERLRDTATALLDTDLTRGGDAEFLDVWLEGGGVHTVARTHGEVGGPAIRPTPSPAFFRHEVGVNVDDAGEDGRCYWGKVGLSDPCGWAGHG
jgi:hypothetical protein